jgi:elongation factor G
VWCGIAWIGVSDDAQKERSFAFCVSIIITTISNTNLSVSNRYWIVSLNIVSGCDAGSYLSVVFVHFKLLEGTYILSLFPRSSFYLSQVPCPLDRLPPQLRLLGSNASSQILGGERQKRTKLMNSDEDNDGDSIGLGHPLHPSTLAYVFKVLHMKGRGGSGDGRVAFARVYSGTLKTRDSVRVISPEGNGSNVSDNDGGKNKKQKHPVERIGGMLELSGGSFGNLPDGSCRSGDVCALVGLKGVVTGDTLLSTSVAGDGGTGDSRKTTAKASKINDVYWKQYMEGVHLSGLASPKPVLTLRVEANSVSEQSRLSTALDMLAVEDPSLVVEETPTTTLISGLGELHMEIILDRLRREFGLVVRTGKPAVSYRETISLNDGEEAETDGLVEYDRTVGAVRLQGAVHLKLRQSIGLSSRDPCFPPIDPVVTLSPEIRTYFNLHPKPTSNESEYKYPPALQALLSGVRGSLKRGRLGPYPLANLECHVLRAHSELSSPETLPGSMRASAANAATTLLEELAAEGKLLILEPKMNVEVWVPSARVGDVLSDLTGRRGTVNNVALAEEVGGGGGHVKSMVRAEVPLVEILGYANHLRSLTGGEGAFSAEYKGHAPQDGG